MLGSLLVIFLTPFTNTSDIRNTTYRPLFKICFLMFIADFSVLMWVGQKPVLDWRIFTGQMATVHYFFSF
jgi:ubiquinol-cytochrome c reductase cytochrome b subunit